MRKRIYCTIFAMCLALTLGACAENQASPVKDEVRLGIYPDEEVSYMVGGQTVQFSAIPESGEIREKIIWRSENEAIATVNENGEVTAKSEGETVIGATVEGQPTLHAETKIKVLPHTESIAVQESEITVLTGSNEVVTLHTEVSPKDAYYQGIHWESSDESIAVVGADGSVFGIAPGKCILTGISEDPECTTTVIVDVTVKIGIEEITLSAPETAYVGKDTHIKAEILPERADKSLVTWRSSDEATATVDAYGNVRFMQAGTVTITCAASDGSHAEGSITLEGVKGVYALRIDQRNPVLLLGGSDTLKSTALTCSIIPADTAFTNVSWTSDNPAVAEVDEKGIVTAHSVGKATITAGSKDSGAKIQSSTVVTVGEAVRKITLSDLELTLAKGHRYSLTATTAPEAPTIGKLKWSSSNEAVLKVNGYGNLQALGVGEATVRCEATDGSGVYAEKTFTVIQQVEKLSFGGKRIVVSEGKGCALEVKVYPESATNQSLKFTSTNPKVATVSATGVVTGVDIGECSIIARSTDGSSKEVRIPVIVEPAVPVKVTSLGRTGYNGYYNEFTATFVNLTTTKTIVGIEFSLEYDAGTDSGSAKFTAESAHLTPGRTRELGSWKASGLNFVDSFTIYLDAVTYYDGSTETFRDTVIGTFQY